VKRYKAIAFPFHVDAPSRRYPLNTSSYNQQMLLGKSKNPDFEGQAYRTNRMAKGKIGDRARKLPPSKKNIREGSLEIIG
jgi:hypothetical protein